MATATALHDQLKAAVNAGDIGAASGALTKLKIELSQLGLLFPTVGGDETKDVGALTAAREILETGAFVSLQAADVPGFERYLSLLSTYYSDLRSSLPSSSNESPLLALSLLRLLSQNRIAEFHTLLETLPPSVLSSPEIEWVTGLEQNLMEGSYSRVFSLIKTSLPRNEFTIFVEALVKTVRSEIASCDERAYETLPLADAKTLLFFESEGQVKEFAAERGWYIDPSTSVVHFATSPLHPNKTAAAGAAGVPSSIASGINVSKELDKEKVVAATLGYARELESIV